MNSAGDFPEVLAESFLPSFRRASSSVERKEAINNYLRSFYEKSSHPKVSDFPLSSEWINTTQSLSIHRDLKGKLVLLDFFTYCCINCMHILPDLKALETKYSIEDGLVVIGVHCAKFTNEKQSKNIASAVRRYGIGHAVVNDSEGIIWNSFDVHCWPTLVLVGPNSELLFALQGEGHFEILDLFIETALNFMSEKRLISNVALPQIRITNELKSFGIFSFPGKVASLSFPEHSVLAVTDTGHNRIVVLSETGEIHHIIGGNEPGFEDGDFDNARFHSPQGIIFKNQNILYVADTENHAIREIKLVERTVKTITGTGKQGQDKIGGKRWIAQEISSPWDVCFGRNTNVLLIAMAGTHQIWALYLSNDDSLFKKGEEGECKVIAGSGREENRNNNYPHAAAFAQPSGLTYCQDRNSVFIADSESSAIRELNLDSGKVAGVVGGSRNPSDLFAFGDKDGINQEIKLQHPLGVTWHEDQKRLFVADSYNHKIKVVDVFENSCSSLKLDFSLDEPGGLCSLRNQIIIADTNNHCLKSYDLTNSTVAVLSVERSTPKKTEIKNHEKNIHVSKNGGKLEIKAKLSTPDNVSFNQEAPAFWTIKFTDDQSNAMALPNIRQKLSLESNFTIDIPQYIGKSSIRLVLDGSAYLCKGDTCFPTDINVIIVIHYVDGANENVSCDFFLSVGSTH